MTFITDIVSTDVQIEHRGDKSNAMFHSQTNRLRNDVVITKTMQKDERRKQSKKTRRYFDKTTKGFLEK